MNLVPKWRLLWKKSLKLHIAGLLLQLFIAQKLTISSNLNILIVFKELIPIHLVHKTRLMLYFKIEQPIGSLELIFQHSRVQQEVVT
jgi:hypothetical protein